MVLEDKNVVVHGGVIGSAVARAFAHEGAKIPLAGRTLATHDRVTEQIPSDRVTLADFMRAACHMIGQESGRILTFGVKIRCRRLDS